MGISSEEYAAFLEKVKRTIYVDNLAPQVTEPVIKTAFNQFGDVKSVHFIPTYLEPKPAPQAALVEMVNPKQAREIITEMGTHPFMILGMPRPVRASAARLEMFDDRPKKPGRQITFCWLDPKDPEFEVAKKMKLAVRRHAAEASIVLEVLALALVYLMAFDLTVGFVVKCFCGLNAATKRRGRTTSKSAK